MHSMEENPKPRSRAFLVACLLISVIPGGVGGVLGATMAIHGGILQLPESLFINALCGGPVVGLGVGYAVYRLQPRRDTWEGCVGWSVLLATNIVVSALLSGLMFYVVARIQRG